MSEEELLQKELIELKCALDASSSDIGDWKIAKIYEYRMLGKEDPYDLEELAAKRQAARDRINELQAELDKINDERIAIIQAQMAAQGQN